MTNIFCKIIWAKEVSLIYVSVLALVGFYSAAHTNYMRFMRHISLNYFSSFSSGYFYRLATTVTWFLNVSH